jgi:hypothetical protein
MNWRESLQIAIQQGTYAKGAKAPSVPEGPTLLHLLHTELQVADSAHDEPDPEQLAHASGVLAAAGVRLMELDGATTVGLWSDLDGPDVRAALRTFRSERLPVRYLDGFGIPARYKLRRVAGEPVPLEVLAAMEQHPADPWAVRDRMHCGAGNARGSLGKCQKHYGSRISDSSFKRSAPSGQSLQPSPTLVLSREVTGARCRPL